MSSASISYVSGPLLRARTKESFALYEAVEVGEQRLLGEVIRLDSEEITVQVYEDTTGLAPGDVVIGHGLPLSIDLGPGILGGIFDGLLRPLEGFDSPFIDRGVQRTRTRRFRFEPLLAVDDETRPGDVFGRMLVEGAAPQTALIPPDIPAGGVRSIVGPGEYLEDATLCVIEDAAGSRHALSAIQRWPVRKARPVASHLPISEPLVTGQRILDSLFPIGLGGKGAVPGGFGTGKTVLLETLAKWCSADIIIYVGCGERGNELTGILEEFPELVDPKNNRRLMERTVMIANTSNMPVAAREASIYTAVTVAEYYRDMGMHVALMADSTSRWAEALRELSGRLGEIPGEGGYPAYLSSRLADFYERAAKVRTLGGAEGSVTIMGTVSPPSGDFSEPVVSHTKRYVRSFWALDAKRAQARMYPAIHPLQSYAEDVGLFTSWWQAQGNADWVDLRRRVLFLLEEKVKLERMARIIGKDALPYEQQLRLLCAELITESFLRQNAFSENDRYTSPERQTVMLKMLSRFTELAVNAVGLGISPDELGELPEFRRLQRMGEEIPEGDLEGFNRLRKQLEDSFQAMFDAAENGARNESQTNI